jgi:hypothetical protein
MAAATHRSLQEPTVVGYAGSAVGIDSLDSSSNVLPEEIERLEFSSELILDPGAPVIFVQSIPRFGLRLGPPSIEGQKTEKPRTR